MFRGYLTPPLTVGGSCCGWRGPLRPFLPPPPLQPRSPVLRAASRLGTPAPRATPMLAPAIGGLTKLVFIVDESTAAVTCAASCEPPWDITSADDTDAGPRNAHTGIHLASLISETSLAPLAVAALLWPNNTSSPRQPLPSLACHNIRSGSPRLCLRAVQTRLQRGRFAAKPTALQTAGAVSTALPPPALTALWGVLVSISCSPMVRTMSVRA